MQFEVEVYRNEVGEWVVTAVEHAVTVTGQRFLLGAARILDALARHFKKST